jgi:CheY-like chemotaxis protein
MSRNNLPIRIVVADDDADDRGMIKEAFEESKLGNPIDFVEDGMQLMDYLRREGKYQHLAGQPYPGFVLLDLNMPRKDGRTALKEIKESAELHRIPIVILTTSKAEEDIIKTYNLGVNSFICKPVSFDKLVEIVKTVGHYWIEIVALPPECHRAAAA